MTPKQTKRGQAGQNDISTPAGQSANEHPGSVLEQAGVGFKSIVKGQRQDTESEPWGIEKYSKSTSRERFGTKYRR
jgi:hypothetical protein